MQVRPHEGLMVDGFTLGEPLHKGGFSSIWSVTHPLYRTPIVMKIPTIFDNYDGPTIVGFETEQMIMPRLSGPHVPKVFAIGDFARLPYIVTERIPGQSLFAKVKLAPLPIDEVIYLGQRMAEALHDIHRQQVIHLDLKPDNFLQRPSGEMVLIDYGLSRHDHLPDLLAEEFTIPLGTFPYIAPEQFLRQRDDLRSDLFALGAMLYEMATGQLPFGQPEKLSHVKRRFWRDPMPPRALRPDIPEPLQEIILRALEVAPAQRTQSAAQMLFDLTYPAQLRLTERAFKLQPDPVKTVLHRWWQRRSLTSFAPPSPIPQQLSRAPILMVAVDLAPAMEPLADHILGALKAMLLNRPDARVACVNVVKRTLAGFDPAPGDAPNIQIARLVALRGWADSLDLGEERLTFTVLDHQDPAAALIAHAASIGAEHIVMGARAHSATRRFLGSVSAKVVAEAPCSVTVIRLPPRAEPVAAP
ncbi:MAG: universal stress protein [Rhodobacteraceae bacterium]|nr:universal stress protein [Paracoccaceae bacterium]